ncbi:MAG TPA: ABC transporter substrate-binding protein [Acidimicrobiia bacterium]|jgi:ABC-type branched-subunit amino acid transport system substrate-binding protein
MRARWIVVAAVVVMAATACSSSSSGKSKSTTTASGNSSTSIASGTFPAVNETGVTPTEIRVSGVAAVTNPLGGDYGSAFDGVQAYFNMVNSQGGIYGRKLVLVKRHDDQMVQNKREVEAIIDQDNAFAVLPVATNVQFSGATLLTQNNIPAYGWGINNEWTGPPNLFGSIGAICNGADCPSLLLPYAAQKLGKKRLAVLAYNVAESAQCLDGIQASFNKYPTAKIVYATKSLSFGVTDMSADVKKMLDAKVDFVTTCMDNNGALTLAREMRQQGLNAIQYMPNAYDQAFMSKNAGFFQGSIVIVQEAPVETTPRFRALSDYITWMGKSNYKLAENAEIGWSNADQFVTGLRGAGPNFTRQKVIDYTNTLTDYDAGGLIGPINWTKQHTDKHYPRYCVAYTRVNNGKFVPIWDQPGKPFTCWNDNPPTYQDAKPYNRQ